MTRVLVVDDSAVYRKLIMRMLAAEPGIEVVGYAADPYEARERIAQLKPDVVTLDVEMPRMDGLEFLEKLMRHHPIPVVLVSTLGTANSEVALRALALGAIDVVPKPGAEHAGDDTAAALRSAVRAAASARIASSRPAPGPARVLQAPAASIGLVAIGASTGGTKAIEVVLHALPAAMAPVVLAIHMPVGFTAAFARRLSSVTAFDVHEATDREVLAPGVALVAPAGRHLRIARAGTRYQAIVFDGPPVRHHRPSIDVLLHSVASEAGSDAVGVLLTGMGQDGARGLVEMRSHGAFTVAEAEESCVVFGMPKVAIELGGAEAVAPLPNIPRVICDAMAGRRRASARTLPSSGHRLG